jgi:transcription elongation GreA/GreB family factor
LAGPRCMIAAAMSRAFVKEGEDAGLEELPELVVSPHRNFVTPEGLALIEVTLARLDSGLSAARAANDRAAVARTERDLRYWRQRRISAELVEPETSPPVVRFGCRVRLRTATGESVGFRIVGEDEADPKHGLVSYVSPLAEELLGTAVGDEIRFRGGSAEIEAID